MGEVVRPAGGDELMVRLAAAGRAWLVAVAAAIAVPATAAEDPIYAAEPAGLWTGPMVSDTPATLQGAEVIDVSALEALMARQPLLIDVGQADRKPDNLPAATIWKPTHRSIPGAVWFPGAGPGDLAADKAEALLQRVGELTKGDRTALVVTFCQPGCWGSWNVGKRLVLAGYTSVHWLPAGVTGWQERNETTAIDPEPGWIPKPPAS